MASVVISPDKIVWKIAYDEDLTGPVGGEWDIGRRIKFASAPKSKSIFDHYLRGVPWEQTELFEIYAVRLASGDTVRGASTMEQLVSQYDLKVSALFRGMERDGFRVMRSRLPQVLIGRDGEIMMGSQGNHRVAIAQILQLEFISCEVKCWHTACRTFRP